MLSIHPNGDNLANAVIREYELDDCGLCDENDTFPPHPYQGHTHVRLHTGEEYHIITDTYVMWLTDAWTGGLESAVKFVESRDHKVLATRRTRRQPRPEDKDLLV